MISPAAFLQIAGILLCGLAFAWAAVGLAQSIQTLTIQRRRFSLEQELLKAEITSVQRRDNQVSAWNGVRRLRVREKVEESRDCFSFYLVPHDNRPLPSYAAGQYITLRLRVPLQSRPIVRCYSLSDMPRNDVYRLTIKRVVQPDGVPGVASSHLIDHVQPGDIIDSMAPTGEFQWIPDRPAVLLGGGIGVTPLVSMLKTQLNRDVTTPIYLFYSVKNGADHAFRDELESIARQHQQATVFTCYTRPARTDVVGRGFDQVGRLTPQVLRDVLPSNNFEFYLCGPREFTQAMRDGLLAWGVPKQAVNFETFGPSKPHIAADAVAAETSVAFDRANVNTTWNDPQQTLLELADANGVRIDRGCCTGSCGTCSTAVRCGKVKHIETPGAPVADGSCLPCIAVPDGPITLDA